VRGRAARSTPVEREDCRLGDRSWVADAGNFEAVILSGLVETIRRRRPLVMIEGTSRSLDVVQFFAEQDYRFAEFDAVKLRLSDQTSRADNGLIVASERISACQRRDIRPGHNVDRRQGVRRHGNPGSAIRGPASRRLMLPTERRLRDRVERPPAPWRLGWPAPRSSARRQRPPAARRRPARPRPRAAASRRQ